MMKFKNFWIQAFGNSPVTEGHWLSGNGSVHKRRALIEETEALIQKNTRHFAKRQITWYKRMPYIHWYERNEFNQDTWCKEITDYVISYFRGECEDGR